MQMNEDGKAAENPPESVEPDSFSAPVEASTKARGAFDVRTKRKGDGQDKKKLYLSIAAVILLCLAVLAGGWAFVISKMNEGTVKVDESAAKKDAALDVDAGNDEGMKQARAEQLRLIAEEDKKKAQAAKDQADKDRKAHDSNTGGSGNSTNSGGNSTTSTGQSTPPPLTPAQRKMGGALVVTPVVQDVSSYGAAGSTNQRSDDPGKPDPGKSHSLTDALSKASDGDGPLGGDSSSKTRGSLSNLSGTSFAPAKAYLAPARKYLVSHNTYTRCALYTEIVTDHPGLVDCRLTDPLYSADGSTVIADAGDRLTGEQTVQVGPGQTTVFTSWTELETQSGVRAKIDSLGAGPMGASGTDAWIDHHYKERFGGAVMLSFIQDALQAVTNSTQKSGSGSGGYTVNNSEENVESMASKALDTTINIPDTGHVLPGTVITVVVARDIDFSSVFEDR